MWKNYSNDEFPSLCRMFIYCIRSGDDSIYDMALSSVPLLTKGQLITFIHCLGSAYSISYLNKLKKSVLIEMLQGYLKNEREVYFHYFNDNASFEF